MRESDELASAFVELEALVRERSRLPGLAAAQEEARRRRGHRFAGVAAGMVLLVLAGVASVVPGWLRQGRPPVLDPSPSVTFGVVPTPSASQSPSPTATPEPAPAAVLGDMTPPERIRNATLDVPAFDVAACPSGRLQFVEASSSSSGGVVRMEHAAFGDVDADGLEDVVVSLRCGPADGTHGIFPVQVLAYSGPGLSPLGAIPTGDLTMVSSLLVSPDGQIVLGMAQTTPAQAIVVDRYYWAGSEIRPLENTVVPADALPVVAVSAAPATVELTPGGAAARFVVTIRNDGPTSALPLGLVVTWPAPISVEVEGFSVPASGSRYDLLIAPPRAGESVTVALRVTLPAGASLAATPEIVGSVTGHRVTDGVSDDFRVQLRQA